jgi:hypothetical protein
MNETTSNVDEKIVACYGRNQQHERVNLVPTFGKGAWQSLEMKDRM